MTSDSRFEVDLKRLVRGFTLFGPVLESCGLSFYSRAHPGGEVNGARVGYSRDWFMMSLLGDDVFPHGVVRWMG
jgi:hypothetical protein